MILSVKHVIDYYNQICAQYKQMTDNLKVYEKEMEEQIVEPERLENIKAAIAPIKASYEQVSWIMYLLNQPNTNRNKRQDKYKKSLAKKMSQYSNSPQEILDKNKQQLENLKEKNI